MEKLKLKYKNDPRIPEKIEASSYRFHTIGAWTAIIFDPIFGVTDYINIPEDWISVFILRCSISMITLVALLSRKKYKLPSFILVFIPFVLISLQNAYTFSLIHAGQFLGHSLNYIALLIGAGMFILWTWQYSVAMIALSILATAAFISRNPELNLHDSLVNGGLLLLVVAIFMIALIQTRYSLTLKNIIANLALEDSMLLLEQKKRIIEEKNADITASINYARRIQTAMLPQVSHFTAYFAEIEIFYQPKDIVSGDFYWMTHLDEENITFVAAVDCTGHGVPGAFMSMIGDSLLNQIILEKKILDPAEILKTLDEGVRSTLHQQNTESRDGMDLTIFAIHHEKMELHFGGAKNKIVWYTETDEGSLKGDPMPIGGKQMKKQSELQYKTQIMPVKKGMVIYSFSDGFIDQFGGVNNTKFSTKRLKELLHLHKNAPMSEQKNIWDSTLNSWMKDGKEHQTDDILLIGVRI